MCNRINLLIWSGVIAFFLIAATLGAAIPTQVKVRAVSRDAKIIGSGVGGAQITIREVETGRVLAQGVQLGGTGDTSRIMVTPRERDATVYDTEGAASFIATVLIDRPTVVEIVAEGPLGTPQSTQRSAKTLLLVPGKDILGEGILLEIHGFTVSLLEPDEKNSIVSGQPLGVRATVRMT